MRRIALLAGVLVVVMLVIGADCSCKKNPTVPIKPLGNAATFQYSTESYRTVSTDPGKKQIHYVFDWGDNKSDTTDPLTSGDTVTAYHAWTANAAFKVRAMAINSDNLVSGWSDPLDVTVGINSPPAAPDPISGPTAGTPKDKIPIWTRATDPDGDSVYIKFFYDTLNKSKTSGWLGPVPSGADVYDTTRYATQGTYYLNAYARDTKGAMSNASTVKAISIGPVGIGWSVYSDNASTFMFPPALAVGTGELIVYACADGDSIYAFKDDGGARPSVSRGAFANTDAVPLDAPTLSSPYLYVPCDDGRLYCLSASNLNVVFDYLPPVPDTGRDAFTVPAVTDNSNVYAGREDGYLYSLNNTGSGFNLNWRYFAYLEIAFPPVISGDASKVFFGNDSGFFCVSNSGALGWRTRLTTSLSSATAIDANGIVWVGLEDGRLLGFDPNDGHIAYETDTTTTNVVGSPVVGPDGTIYCVRDDGIVFAYASGAIAWSRELTGATVSAAPCLAPDSTIIVHSDEDIVFAVKLYDPNHPIEWQIQLPTSDQGRRHPRKFAYNVGCAPTIGPNNSRIYVGSNGDPYFYAISVDKASYAAGLPSTPWPKFQHDLRNSGYKSGTWAF